MNKPFGIATTSNLEVLAKMIGECLKYYLKADTPTIMLSKIDSTEWVTIRDLLKPYLGNDPKLIVSFDINNKIDTEHIELRVIGAMRDLGFSYEIEPNSLAALHSYISKFIQNKIEDDDLGLLKINNFGFIISNDQLLIFISDYGAIS